MNKIKYMNFQAGVPMKHYDEEHAVPDATMALPVELLSDEALEDGTVKVRAMAECSLVLACGENGAMIFTADKNEELGIRPDELSDEPVKAFRERGEGDAAWEMTAEERAPYEAVWENHKGMSSDRAGEIFDQAGQFGVESLAPEDQDLLSLDTEKMMAVGAMMYQCGRMSEDYDKNDYGSYGHTDTGRYLQIELPGAPGTVRNVYEAPMSGGMHQFWDMEPGEGKVNFMSVAEGAFDIKGIYAGCPFQAEREAAEQARRGGPEGPARTRPGRMSAYERMMGVVSEMDTREGCAPEGPEDDTSAPDR